MVGMGYYYHYTSSGKGLRGLKTCGVECIKYVLLDE